MSSTIRHRVGYDTHHHGSVAESCSAGFEEEIKKIDDGVDLVVDFIGRNYFNSNLNLLRRDGTLVFLAFMSGPVLEDNTNIMQLLFKRLTIKGSTLRSRTVEYQKELLQSFEKDALGLITKGEMKVQVHEVSYGRVLYALD
jgi:NADPH:quinone reductase-like Zn-dependent oxidoreductase